jgi:glutamate-1-semialdehyde 2,1-aminomutase
VRANLQAGSVLQAASGVMLEDRDGNRLYDLTGSYGVNVFGNDFYKTCIEAGAERARTLGPVLGAYHPSVVYNVRRLREISGCDEVSFHMSGTEAVMQAVRLARYHTGKRKLVRFCGAYHGWWGDVQPGIGNPVPARDTFTLEEMAENTLRVLRTRSDIACVLVNPLQALHPNVNAPSDGSLVDSSRRAHFVKAAYQKWLQQLRRVCSEAGIVLIFDEVFMGFRLAPRGAQEYFGVQADLVTYGKTVAGGLPIGIVCGRRDLMKRYRDDRPGDICFARGTFNAHPYVMAAMQEFLARIEAPAMLGLYCDLDRTWDSRAALLNKRLRDRDLPVQVANMSTVWTVLYSVPARYNWMFQYYLRAEGLALSWVGTGRLIFSLNYTHEDFEEVAVRFVRAAEAMQRDGWWAHPAESDKAIRRSILREVIGCRLGMPGRGIRSVRPAPAAESRPHPDDAAHDSDR